MFDDLKTTQSTKVLQLPPLRTFKVTRDNPTYPDPNDAILTDAVEAHAITFESDGILIFIEYTLDGERLLTSYKRILRNFIEVEEVFVRPTMVITH